MAKATKPTSLSDLSPVICGQAVKILAGQELLAPDPATLATEEGRLKYAVAYGRAQVLNDLARLAKGTHK